MALRKRIVSGILLAVSCLSLTSCNQEAVDKLGENFQAAANNLLPNLWITLTQLIVFIVTACVVIFLAYKPLKKKLSKRADTIQKNLKDSEDAKAQAKADAEKAKAAILDAQKKAGDIVTLAQKTADDKAASAQQALQASIEQQKEQAHKDIEAERQRMLKEAHDEIVDTALSASKEILGREINVEDNKKLVDAFINQMSQKNQENQ